MSSPNCPCLDTYAFQKESFQKKKRIKFPFWQSITHLYLTKNPFHVVPYLFAACYTEICTISIPLLLVKVAPWAQMDLFKENNIHLCLLRKTMKRENESRNRRRKDAICTDQLNHWAWLHFNVFEGKPWCAMSLSSFLSVSVITVIFLNQVKMRNEFNNTWVWQPCL